MIVFFDFCAYTSGEIDKAGNFLQVVISKKYYSLTFEAIFVKVCFNFFCYVLLLNWPRVVGKLEGKKETGDGEKKRKEKRKRIKKTNEKRDR